MGTNRKDELDRDGRNVTPSAAPGLPAEQAALPPSLPIADVQAEQGGAWRRFLSALMRALSAWGT
jgi:hypothetical protein